MNLIPTPDARFPSTRILALVLATAAAALLAGPATVPAAAWAAAPAQAAAESYELVDTWASEPWHLTAGRFAEVADVSSAPDGTIFVVDSYQGAVHVLAADGTPRMVFVVPGFGDDGMWTARRIDVGFDGLVYVLSDGIQATAGVFPTRVDRFTPGGRLEYRFEVGAMIPSAYVDLAIRADRRIYLSRAGEGNPYIEWPGPTPTPSPDGRPQNAVEVFDRDGRHLESLSPPELAVPGDLDVAADGTIYVINRVPSPWGQPPEGPEPTARPSLAQGPPGQDVDQLATSAPPTPVPTATPEVAPIEGVLIFEPDHRYRETVPYHGGEDVAVGAAGVFVSRNVEIHALRDPAPVYSGPAGRVVNGFFDRLTFNLDVTADGRLLAGMNHCYLQGVLVFADPTRRPSTPTFAGANDAPFLEGPPYPVRLAASEEIAVLQGRFEVSGTGSARRYMATNYLFEPQSVQRWTRHGEVRPATPLVSQLGVCAGSDSWFTRDVAIDGTDVYTVDPNLVQMRPDDRLPRWTTAPAAIDDPEADPRLSAVSADAGRVAVLAAGTASVYVLDREGKVVTRWSLSGADANALPVDLAVHGDRVYLGDLGRGRITVRALDDGAILAEWPTHDGVRAVASGPDGDVFVLGRGGWGFRHAPDGKLEAAWPMPDRALDALDIAVDVDGRVYVSYVEPGPVEDVDVGRDIFAFRIDQAGIWVFEPVAAAPVPPPPTDACLVRRDKGASPARIPLGAEVEVALSVDGVCPGSYDPVQVVLVLDTSRSMNFGDAIGRGRDSVAALLARLDPRAAEVALVTFEEGAALKAPLSRDIATAGALALSGEVTGDTRLTPGIEVARQELTGPRGNTAARRIVLIVSDGIFHDDPLAAADAARADGLEVWALVVQTYEFTPEARQALEQITANPDHVFTDPTAPDLARMGDDLIRFRPQTGLFRQITVVDEVPANMSYVGASAEPTALWDRTARTLTWSLGRVSAGEPILLTYRLRPLEVGTWPTNVQATAPYRDVLGASATLVFPVPEVEVYSLARPIYLPFLSNGQCFRTPRPLDVVLVMDTSSTMAEQAPGGGTKLAAAQAAARTFLGYLRFPADHGAVVAFDETARREVPLTGDAAAVAAGIDRLATRLGTHIDLGLAEARRVLADGARPEARPVVVLLTDGLNNDGPDPVRLEAAALQGSGALIYTIGLGADADVALLAEIATSPDRSFASPTAAELASIYAQISEMIACDTP